jgi:hypothetical protein
MPVISALRRLRQEDHEFNDSLSYIRPWRETHMREEREKKRERERERERERD